MDTEKVQVEHLAGTVADVMVSVTINQSAAGVQRKQPLSPCGPGGRNRHRAPE